MREAFEPELHELRRKRDPRTLSINRGLMADDAHFAFDVTEVFGVTFKARGVSGQYWLRIVVRADVTDRAVLRLALVFLAIVIKRRGDFDQLRLNYVERRLTDRRWRRRILDRFVQVLLGASTSPESSQQDEGCGNYSF